MSAARTWRDSGAVTEPRLASTGSNRRRLQRIRRTAWSFAVGLCAASTILCAASPASARSLGASRPTSGSCGCAASVANAGGVPASHGQESSGTGNGNAYGHDRGQGAGVPQDQPPGLGGENGEDKKPVGLPQAQGPHGGGNGHASNGRAARGQGGEHGHQGGERASSPQPVGGSAHADRTAPGPPPWAASRRASASSRVTKTPTPVSPPTVAPTPPTASGASAATGPNARAPRIVRQRSRSAPSIVRRRLRSNASRRSNRLAARPAATSRRAHASTVAAGAPASPVRRTDSGPDSGRTQHRHRPGAADGGSFLSAPLALPRTIERLVQVVPAAVWVALLAAIALAAAAAAAAVLAARRGRRQARAIAAAERTAATDPLTGVLNRRGFGEAVERELARARRHNHPFALAYLDVRGLKAVNDGDGHLVGDELIKQVANLLRECARAGDVVGRLGGDEFALLLAEQSAEGAASAAGRLRGHLPACRAAIGSDVPWDLTVGTASYPEDGESFETLLCAADRRLYAQRGIRLGRAANASVLAAAATES